MFYRSNKVDSRSKPAGLLVIALILAGALLTQTIAAPNGNQVGTMRIEVMGQTLPALAQIRGSRVWLPIVALVSQLGYIANIDSRAEIIVIRRGAVESRFVKQTGEVSANGVVFTNIPGQGDIVFPANATDLFLPLEIVTALLGVSISVDPAQTVVRVEQSGATGASQSSTPRGRIEIGQLDYNFGLTNSQGTTTQNLYVSSRGRIGDDTYQAFGTVIGGAYGPFNSFQSGNFTLYRHTGSRLQAGDFTTSSGLLFSSALVRGVEYDMPFGDKKRLTVYGGQTVSEVPIVSSTFGPVSRFQGLNYNSTIFGGHLTYEPLKITANTIKRRTLSFTTGGSMFRGPQQKGQMVDSGAHYTGDLVHFDVEAAAGSFNGTTSDHRQIDGFGSAFQASGSYTPWKLLTLQALFNNFSPNFISTQPGGQYTGRREISVGASIRPTDRLSFGGTYSTTTALTSTNIDTRTYTLSGAVDPPTKWLPRAIGTYTHTDSPVGQLGTLIINLSREYKSVRPFFNYSLLTGAGRSNTLSFGTGLTTRLGSFQVQQSLTSGQTKIDPRLLPCFINATCLADASRIINTTSTGSVDWYAPQTLIRRIQFGIGGGYDRANKETKILARAFATMRLGSNHTLQFSYVRTGFGSEVRLTLSGSLLFWKPKSDNPFGTPTDSELLNDSTIMGQIYVDENFNHRFDASVDKPLSGLTLMLDSGRTIVTTETGAFRFDHVAPGEHILSLRPDEIRADLVTATGLDQKLVLMPRVLSTTEFRLVKSGGVGGRVWLDKNGDGKFDDGDSALPDVHILSSSGRDTYTDENGYYQLGELPPGQQTIYIDQRYMPAGLLIASPQQSAVIKPKEQTHDIDFVFKPQPREIEIKIFSGKSGQDRKK